MERHSRHLAPIKSDDFSPLPSRRLARALTAIVAGFHHHHPNTHTYRLIVIESKRFYRHVGIRLIAFDMNGHCVCVPTNQCLPHSDRAIKYICSEWTHQPWCMFNVHCIAVKRAVWFWWFCWRPPSSPLWTPRIFWSIVQLRPSPFVVHVHVHGNPKPPKYHCHRTYMHTQHAPLVGTDCARARNYFQN